MSEDEQDFLCGQTLRHHRETKGRLACLRTKLRNLLEQANIVVTASKNDVTIESRDGKLFVRGAGDSVEWPSEESLIGLVEEIQTTRTAVAQLTEQLHDMGYSEYLK